MNEMLTYIFGSLRSSETAIKVIQKTHTRNMNLAVITMCLWIILGEMRFNRQDAKMRMLAEELGKLKNPEGE